MTSAESLDKLIDTISRIEQRNAALEDQAHVLTRLADRLPRAEEEARNARADKAALEQEIRLGGAQRAARRINALITVVPRGIMASCMASTMLMFVSIFFMALPIGTTGIQMYPMVLFMALFVISIRPVNTKFIRMFVYAQNAITVAQQFGPQLGFTLAFTLVESLRPYPTAVMWSMVGLQSTFMLTNLFGAYYNRDMVGEAGRMSRAERSKLTKAFMVETLGSEKKARTAMLAWYAYPIWEGTALATKCDWPYSTRFMMNRINKMILLTMGVQGLFILPITPVCFLWMGTAADFMPPPRAGNLTSDERASYMAAAHFDVLLYACAGPAFFVSIGAAFLFRGRIHAWLIGLATSSDAGRAAGVAAMIGKLEPQAVLGMARRTFTGLSLELLSKDDFFSNADTGLNAKARRCRLGEVDAFLSHSECHGAANPRLLLLMGARLRPVSLRLA